jgi:Flp pilus assembly protein TadD
VDRGTLRLSAVALAALLTAATAGAAPGGSSTTQTDSEFGRGKVAIEERRFDDAIALFTTHLGYVPYDADAHNLMGFALRQLKRFPEARRHYDEALRLQPNHRAALEYYGELFVETGDLEAARALLTRLVQLCPRGCTERAGLEKAIALRAP